ncbi:MAG TPA: hypothetical protein VG276_02310 [Actinomycetes bacterium]|nr:hypothetical protein [Actinomycetes bacterium]
MSERYGYGYGDDLPGDDLPVSRRGAVTERHHDRDHDDDVREIDLTDDADDRDRDGRPDAELVGEEGDHARATDHDDQTVRAANDPDDADTRTRSTVQFAPAERDRDHEPEPASRSAYGGDVDAGPRSGLPADQAGAPGFEREERDLDPLDRRTADPYGDVRGDRDDAPGPAPGPLDAERPTGGEGVSRVDLRDEDSAWSSDVDHRGVDRAGEVDHRGVDRADEVELATPTPAPHPASVPDAGPPEPLAPAASTDTGAGTDVPDDASSPPATDLATAQAAAPAAAVATLLASVDAESVRRQFLDIQAGFVDEPRQAVQQAGELVDDLVRQVTQSLTAERERLQADLSADTTSTEDLRLALRAYRAYVDRLLGLTM